MKLAPPTPKNAAGPIVRRQGFTLIELIIVVTVLTILLAAVTPVYRESLKNARKDQAVRNILAAMRYAQERAITDATEYRIYLDSERGSFWVMRLAEQVGDKKTFEPLNEPDAGRIRLPEGLEMRKPKAQLDRDQRAHYIAFYPQGACDFAEINLRFRGRERISVKTQGALGRFEVVGK